MSKRYIVCYFCGKPATDGDYCHGCKHYVCVGCHQTNLRGYKHLVEEHRISEKFWLISDKTYQSLVRVLGLAASPGVKLAKVHFIQVLHDLETGVHKTDAIPEDDEITEDAYHRVLKSLEEEEI